MFKGKANKKQDIKYRLAGLFSWYYINSYKKKKRSYINKTVQVTNWDFLAHQFVSMWFLMFCYGSTLLNSRISPRRENLFTVSLLIDWI